MAFVGKLWYGWLPHDPAALEKRDSPVWQSECGNRNKLLTDATGARGGKDGEKENFFSAFCCRHGFENCEAERI